MKNNIKNVNELLNDFYNSMIFDNSVKTQNIMDKINVLLKEHPNMEFEISIFALKAIFSLNNFKFDIYKSREVQNFIDKMMKNIIKYNKYDEKGRLITEYKISDTFIGMNEIVYTYYGDTNNIQYKIIYSASSAKDNAFTAEDFIFRKIKLYQHHFTIDGINDSKSHFERKEHLSRAASLIKDKPNLKLIKFWAMRRTQRHK